MIDTTSDRATNQRGEISTFVIIALVLIVILGGVVVIAKIRSDNAANNEPTVTQTETDDSEDETTQTDTETSDQPATEAPAEEETGSTSQDDQAAAPATGPTGVPSTGPVEIISGIVGLSSLSYAGGRYFASKRRLLQKSLGR